MNIDNHYSPGRGEDYVVANSQLMYNRSLDSRRQYTDANHDKSNQKGLKMDLLVDLNDTLKSKLKEQTGQLNMQTDQARVIDNLSDEVYQLKKQLKHEKRQKSQLKTSLQEDTRNNQVDRQLGNQKKQIKEELQVQMAKIAQISNTCEQLYSEQQYQNDKIQQKNEEIRILLLENDHLRQAKKQFSDIAQMNEILQIENNQLKERIQSIQEDLNIIQTEKKDSHQKLKEEINKLKIENNDLLETGNHQLDELQDCINMTNKYKDIIINQQKSLETYSEKNQDIIDTLIAIDELVCSSSKQKDKFIIFQGEPSSAFDLLYILKSNIITLQKSFQDLKHSKNNDEVKELKESFKILKCELEQSNTEKLVISQQFEETIVMMKQSIIERNQEEQKLKGQLSELSSQVQILDQEMDSNEFKKYQKLSLQFGSYVNVMHSKLGQLVNIKQTCNSFVTGYIKLLEKVNILTKQLSIPRSNNVSKKDRAIKILKKCFRVVYFACLLQSRRSILKSDTTLVCQMLKQSQKGVQPSSIDWNKEFGSIVLSLRVQKEEMYPYIINQQESTKLLSQIENYVLLTIQDKDQNISQLQQKLITFSQDLQEFTLQREDDQRLLQEMKQIQQEFKIERKQLEEENTALSEKLKYRLQHYVEETKVGSSSHFQTQDNFHSINPQSLNSNSLVNSQFFSSQNNGNNFEDIQVRHYATNIDSNRVGKDQLKKQRSTDQISYDAFKIASSSSQQQVQSNRRKTHINGQNILEGNKHNVYVIQDQQTNSDQFTSDKKQAYLELKRQQQELQDKLIANSKDRDHIKTANQYSHETSSSKRNQIDSNIPQSIRLLQNSSNLVNDNIYKRINNRSLQSNPIAVRNNSITNQSGSFAQGLPNTNNYTFNNSSAQLLFSDSNRKAKTIQDQLKQELYESQKFSKFLTNYH